MIDKMQGAKWGYINEKQEPEPIPEKYQELIEIREKAVADYPDVIPNQLAVYQKVLDKIKELGNATS